MQQQVTRTSTSHDIKYLIGTSQENTFLNFEPNRDINSSNARIRIPEHQRYYCWDVSKQEPLIDTIMIGYPMPLMVLTQHTVPTGSRLLHVQDGQQRLITLQNYLLDKFTWNNKKYSELDMEEKLVFLGYKINCEIIEDPTPDQVAEIFERLNCGKPLTDNDKFWNRRNSPVIDFIMNQLIAHETLREGFKKYIGHIGSGKKRSQLSDIVGAVVAILTDSIYNIRTSFERIGPHLHMVLTDENRQLVIDVFREYFAIIEDAMSKKSIVKPRKLYGKLSNMLGIYLCWKLSFTNCKSEIERWTWYAWNIQILTWRYKYFAPLSPGARRNIDANALKERTDFIMNPNPIYFQNIENNEESENESDSENDSNSCDDDDSSNTN
uniref:GmrSD restriction endonucleases N-terminal domain-containing protein n=1 Tax=viral metagenome TaxID=1070528 RepID=A0A6C0HZM3_9ZZZZ